MKKILLLLVVSFGFTVSIFAQKASIKSKSQSNASSIQEKIAIDKMSKQKLAEETKKQEEQKKVSSKNAAALSNVQMNVDAPKK